MVRRLQSTEDDLEKVNTASQFQEKFSDPKMFDSLPRFGI